MVRFSTLAFTAALVAGGVSAAASGAEAATLVQVASFNQVGGGKTFAWDGSGANAGRLISNSSLAVNPTASAYAGATAQWIDVLFNLNDAGLYGLTAQLLFDASAPSGGASQLTAGAPIRQSDLNGSFQFKYTGLTPITAYGNTIGTGGILLSGTFTHGWLSVGGTSGGLADSFALTGGTVTLASDVIPANRLFDGDLALAFTGLNQVAAITGSGSTRQLRDFRASVGGVIGAAAVPEPATWGLMIGGFFGTGSILRRRRRALPVA